MKGTWWVGSSQLTEEQKQVITLPLKGNYLVSGPPGSGKTNLLVLRANHLSLSGKQDLIVLTFTRTLREFTAAGGANYSFPSSKIQTYGYWQRKFLADNGVTPQVEDGDDFSKSRKRLFQQIQELCSNTGLTNIYSAVLVDEAQDYQLDEIQLLRSLTGRLFLVADSRQQIYRGNATLTQLSSVVDKSIELQHHHRCGRAICRVADRLAKHPGSYASLEDTCNYNEPDNPSEVTCQRYSTIDDQLSEMIKRIKTQLKAFPDELIGVIAPKPVHLEPLWQALSQSSFASVCAQQRQGEYVPFEFGKRVYLATIHSSKGCEFRCVHIPIAEGIAKIPMPRNSAFTAVTRAQTSLSLYHTDDLPGYLEEAVDHIVNPGRRAPTIDDVFRGGS